MKIVDLVRVLKDELAEQNLSGEANASVNLPQNLSNSEINGVSFDSREVRGGFAFVAVKGVKTDGHLFIPQAVKAGAAAVICEDMEAYEKYSAQYPSVLFLYVKNARVALAVCSAEFYERACDKLTIIGITGTKGKTSTSFMTAAILKHAGIRTGIIGTNGAYFEDFYEELEHSTPESRDLHRLFYEMQKRGATHIVMEVSSQSILMSRVQGITFDTAVFTNITPDHIGEGEHRDFDDYLFCKGKLFTMCKRAVVNIDSDKAPYILDICQSGGVPVKTFVCDMGGADYTAQNVRFFIDRVMSTSFDVIDKDGMREEIDVGAPGKFSVFNALCALTVARSIGIGTEHIKAALKNVKVVGRIEPVPNEYCKAPVIIDYAHNAVSLESLFEAVKAYSPKRIICVFGCGGNRSKLRRYEMGEVSGKYADLSVITTDNSRFEELDDIIADILIGMKKTDGKYVIIKDRREAIHYAMSEAREGDVVLLAGKGQETYLDVKGVKTHFDEREAVSEYRPS